MTDMETVGMDAVGPCSMTEDKQSGPITNRHRRLLTREEVHMQLGLDSEQVQFLINTRQITRIRIAGEERFDSREIDGLIDSYKATAQRRAQ
jgi:hypothetical protein